MYRKWRKRPLKWLIWQQKKQRKLRSIRNKKIKKRLKKWMKAMRAVPNRWVWARWTTNIRPSIAYIITNMLIDPDTIIIWLTSKCIRSSGFKRKKTIVKMRRVTIKSTKTRMQETRTETSARRMTQRTQAMTQTNQTLNRPSMRLKKERGAERSGTSLSGALETNGIPSTRDRTRWTQRRTGTSHRWAMPSLIQLTGTTGWRMHPSPISLKKEEKPRNIDYLYCFNIITTLFKKNSIR